MRRAALPVLLAAMALAAACQRTGAPAPVDSVGAVPLSGGGAVSVAPGDTLYSIARRLDVPLRELIGINNAAPPYTIEPGQRLLVPAPRQYVVQRGDTLYGVSRMFGVDSSELTRLNDLPPPYAVEAGRVLRLPGESGAIALSGAPRPAVQAAELPPPGTRSPASVLATPIEQPPIRPGAAASVYEPGQAPKPLQLPSSKPTVMGTPAPVTPAPAYVPDAAPPVAPPAAPETAAAPPPRPDVGEPPARTGGRFLWPVAGRVVSPFGPKPDGTHNDGVNIEAAKGTPVIAADDGVVAYAGNELRGFGNLLLVRHSDGWITAYAHLDRMEVERGATVTRGQRIGTVGQTGSVTSPQLHFELRRGSEAVDPSGHLDGAAPRLSSLE